MNCPECGRFMKLKIAEAAGKDGQVWECAFWWVCWDEDWLHNYIQDPIPAPEYQWLWNCEGIPARALLEDDELRQEYDEMWARLPDGYKRRYRHALKGVLPGY